MTQEWKQRGACARLDADDADRCFFPAGTAAATDEVEAKAICGTCIVRTRCLAHAIANREQGIWGGATDREREYLRRKAQRIARGAQAA
ncbi:WhiB family transcriptional regulator [Kitasatospora kazusensis]|uniref:WhiB family transcriptional regulator n=1 Tax=Kitasatospora kazusensis TaxID=407974 RepID=A0ABN2ZG59_9ACTN